jgi:hypothetical protein
MAMNFRFDERFDKEFQIAFRKRPKSGSAHTTGGKVLEFEPKSSDRSTTDAMLKKNNAGYKKAEPIFEWEDR